MGREVRRVPADWKHPTNGHYANGKTRHLPLFPGEDYGPRAKAWRESLEAKGLQATLDDEGDPPNAEDYMPDWPASERTHLQMYETCSEGTPISPVCATPEELARWLADNGASAFGSMTATYEEWLVIAGGTPSVGSAVAVNGRMMSGVEAASSGALKSR